MMKRFNLLLVLASLAGVSQAVVLTQSDLMVTPGGSSYTYAGFGVTASTSTLLLGLDSSNNDWDGLWVGSNNITGTYKFTFDSQVTNFQMKFTAHSGNDPGFEEQWDTFKADGSSAAIALSNNNISGHETVLTGGAIRSLVGDGFGTVSYAGNLTTFEWTHDVITGSPNGTVITEVSWDVVPEPCTLLVIGAGLAAIAKRRNRKV